MNSNQPPKSIFVAFAEQYNIKYQLEDVRRNGTQQGWAARLTVTWPQNYVFTYTTPNFHKKKIEAHNEACLVFINRFKVASNIDKVYELENKIEKLESTVKTMVETVKALNIVTERQSQILEKILKE